MKFKVTRLSEIIREQGRTNNWIAHQLNVVPESVSRWRHGFKPSDDNMMRLAKLFDVPVDMLFPNGSEIKKQAGIK